MPPSPVVVAPLSLAYPTYDKALSSLWMLPMHPAKIKQHRFEPNWAFCALIYTFKTAGERMNLVVHPWRIIVKGRLEFNTQRAYDMATKAWQTRTENYYKADVLFRAEQVFIPEDCALVIEQQKLGGSEKAWTNTTLLLAEMAQYAVAGSIKAWAISNSQSELMKHIVIEPQSEKEAVTSYLRGRKIVQEGEYGEATAALSHAITKYERHAAAYERRGYVNYKLKNYHDALRDFSKSIALNSQVADPYYGAGKVRMLRNEWEQAAADFDNAIKRTIALEPLHWLARLKRGESLYHAKQYKEAVAEFRHYLKRSFAESDPNFRHRRRAFFLLGKSLAAVNDVAGSEEALQQALSTKQGTELVPDYEALLALGIVRRHAGKPFTSDLEKAAQLGSDEAQRLLSALG